MKGILQQGTIKKSNSGISYTVIKLLGEGGQGEVYLVESAGKSYALKWYFKRNATKEQRTIIDDLVSKPAPTKQFLWPIDIVEDNDIFGYIMKLRPDNYKGIADMMTRKAEPTFSALCMAAYNLAEGYRNLHLKGYCYRDISFGNVFFDPLTGDVLIGDNDNVAPNRTENIGVLGTPRFMAPEVVTGKEKPSIDSDIFSMNILLFYMLMVHHPLEGASEANLKCLDAVAMNKLYGTEPVFIFDPMNTTNRPIAGYQDNALIFWEIYPTYIRDLFTQTFTEGIRFPNKRVMEKQWGDALLKLRDNIIMCPSCGQENFYDIDKLKRNVAHICWSCQRTITLPPRLRVGNMLVMLNKDTVLTEHHMNSNYNLTTKVAEVTQHPTDPSRWGIKNLSKSSWVYKNIDGTTLMIDVDKNAPLMNGAKIDFGSVEGEIKTQ